MKIPLVQQTSRELKTVQIMDELEIPRPCIDARTVGYNVEWSQELKLEQSLTEYVGAWLMLHILKELDPPGRKEVTDSDPFIFDMSVGYDLNGHYHRPRHPLD